ncbi:MAG: hypothetical protein HC803_08385 [Saprospiraceae bacterium]|nr:hypothetical protein [Saprospiraceae bacterium]
MGLQYSDVENSVIKEVYKNPNGNDTIIRDALPILSIYFLGHQLDKVKDVPVIKVERSYVDVATGTVLEEREAFIESLTHDSFIIQIPNIKGHRRTELEKLLYILTKAKSINRVEIDIF